MTDEVISSLLREIPGVYRTMRVDRLMKECLAYGLRRFQWRVSVYMWKQWDTEWLCAWLMLATVRNVLSDCAAVMLEADHSADVHRC